MGKRSAKILVVDTETTGLSAKTDSIIEIGMCVVHFEGKVFQGLGDVLESFINPETLIPEEASNINHITDDMVKDAPTYLDQNLRTRVNALCEECDYITGHNLPFDMRFLIAYSTGFEKFTKEKQICTLRAARHIWPMLKNHKLAFIRTELLTDELKSLGKHHNLFESLQNHRALSDVFIDVALLKLIMDKGACGTKSWKKFILKTLEPTPVNKLPFGKYRGRLFTEIAEKDPAYLRWLLQQDWFQQKENLALWTKKLLEDL